MQAKTLDVGIATDAIKQITKVAVERAIEELIWNALDADAVNVQVTFRWNAIGGIDQLVVSDDGHGIPYGEAEAIFRQIGGSSKALRRRSLRFDRPYHGREGKGRYKAMSIGRNVVWCSRATENGRTNSFNIKLAEQQISKVEIGPPVPSSDATGCEVTITGIYGEAKFLGSEACFESLAYRFAPYLIGNHNVRITYNGRSIHIDELLTNKKEIALFAPGEDGIQLSATLRILEWKKKTSKASLYLCDEHGLALDEVPPGVRETPFPFTAYIQSDTLRHHKEQDTLLDLVGDVRKLKEAATGQLKRYLRHRAAQEAANVATRMKADGVYPYPNSPNSPTEKAEQEVFDICAQTIHQYLPDLEESEKKARKLTYKLLQSALSHSPSHLNTILAEVFKLDQKQQGDLAELLTKTTLGAIIHTAKTVSDRLCFINGLEQILHYKPFSKLVKERKQLHKILLDELWIFGDEYTLGASDVSLKNVLQAHCHILGRTDLSKQLTEEEARDLSDIPDLMLWQQAAWRPDHYMHLVVELKRPSLRLGVDELTQVKKYATAVVKNPHFDKATTTWKFVVVNDEISEDIEGEVYQRGRDPGHVIDGDNYTIWVLRWSEVIQKAKFRLKYMQDKLNIAVADNDDGLSYLKAKYASRLPDAVIDAV